MAFKKRSTRTPLVTIGDGTNADGSKAKGEHRLAVEGVLVAIRQVPEFDNPIYDFQTSSTERLSVNGCAAINDKLSPADLGWPVRLTWIGWGETKRGKRYRDVETEVDTEVPRVAVALPDEAPVEEPGGDDDLPPF